MVKVTSSRTCKSPCWNRFDERRTPRAGSVDPLLGLALATQAAHSSGAHRPAPSRTKCRRREPYFSEQTLQRQGRSRSPAPQARQPASRRARGSVWRHLTGMNGRTARSASGGIAASASLSALIVVANSSNKQRLSNDFLRKVSEQGRVRQYSMRFHFSSSDCLYPWPKKLKSPLPRNGWCSKFRLSRVAINSYTLLPTHHLLARHARSSGHSPVTLIPKWAPKLLDTVLQHLGKVLMNAATVCMFWMFRGHGCSAVSHRPPRHGSKQPQKVRF